MNDITFLEVHFWSREALHILPLYFIGLTPCVPGVVGLYFYFLGIALAIPASNEWKIL